MIYAKNDPISTGRIFLAVIRARTIGITHDSASAGFYQVIHADTAETPKASQTNGTDRVLPLKNDDKLLKRAQRMHTQSPTETAYEHVHRICDATQARSSSVFFVVWRVSVLVWAQR